MESNPYTSPVSNPFGSTGTGTEIVSQDVITPLVRTKFWVRLISVLLWIMAAIMLLAGLGMGISAAINFSSGSETVTGTAESGFLIGFSMIYVVFSFFYILPAIKLWTYGTQISTLAISRSPADLVLALNTQRSFWKIIGVLTLVGIIMMIAIFLSAIVFGTAVAMKGLSLP
jgi:hypothetical protein